jgi:hypothetical protein
MVIVVDFEVVVGCGIENLYVAARLIKLSLGGNFIG